MKRWFIIGLFLLVRLELSSTVSKPRIRSLFMPEELRWCENCYRSWSWWIGWWGFFGDVVERDITLSIAHELKTRLEKKGATVVMTRTKDGDALAEHAPRKSFEQFVNEKWPI